VVARLFFAYSPSPWSRGVSHVGAQVVVASTSVRAVGGARIFRIHDDVGSLMECWEAAQAPLTRAAGVFGCLCDCARLAIRCHGYNGVRACTT
jgi:hypothetical protein